MLFIHKKKEILTFVTIWINMDSTEPRKTRERLYNLTYM